MNRAALLSLIPLLMLAGCGSSSPPVDVVGPFTGSLHRFYVSSITLPATRDDFAIKFFERGLSYNELGNVIGALAGSHDAAEYADDLVAARVIDATVEIISDDPNLTDDATVGARWNGVAGQPGELTGGVLKNGILTTNRVRYTHHPASGILSVPVFKDADPSLLNLLSYDLTLYADGAGGFAGELYSVASTDGLATRAWTQFQQMMAAHPEEHARLFDLMDANKDGQLTMDEFLQDGFIKNLTHPDVHWDDNGVDHDDTTNAFSAGIGIALTACIDEACTRPLPAPTCHDRIKNGDEKEVDCGGSCEACLR